MIDQSKRRGELKMVQISNAGRLAVRSLLACVSTAALCALLPGLAAAQSTDVGGPGKALTTGVITDTGPGVITDGGANAGVQVAAAPNDLILVQDATIKNLIFGQPALQVTSSSNVAGRLTVRFGGTNLFAAGASASGISVISPVEAILIDASNASLSGSISAKVTSGSGDIAIKTGATNGATPVAVTASTTGGAIALTTAPLALSGPISATVAGGSGSISLNTGDVYGPPPGVAVGASITNGGSGSISINAGSITGFVSASTNGAGDVAVTANSIYSAAVGGSPLSVSANGGHLSVNVAGSVTGMDGGGITARNAGSGVTDIFFGGAAGGVDARTTGTGAINIGSAAFRFGASNVPGNAAVTATGGGAINVFGGSAYTQGASLTSAVVAQSTGGPVTVDFTGSVTNGLGGGVLAQTAGGGSTTVKVGGVSARATGIEADATGGNTAGTNISVTAAGPIVTYGTGIVTNAGYNPYGLGLTTILAGSITAGAGINAVSTGGGAINIGSTTQRVGPIAPPSGSASTGAGIYASSSFASPIGVLTGGDISIFGTSLQGLSGVAAIGRHVLIDLAGPVVATAGSGIAGQAGDLGSVQINTTGSVTATGGAGISAQGGSFNGDGGDITINATAVTANALNGNRFDGVFAQLGGVANLKITTTGAVTGSLNGIEAIGYGVDFGQQGVTINAGGPVVGAGGYGILATNRFSGPISITAQGPVSGASGGIKAFSNFGAGDVSVVANGPVSGGAYAIEAGIAGTGFGNVSVLLNGANTVSGVYAHTAGPGNLTVTSTDPGSTIWAINGGTGVYASAGGGAINLNLAGAINTDLYGIRAFNTGGGSININDAGSISGGAIGIVATTQNGSINIGGTMGLGGPINAAFFGVLASSGSGDTSVTTSATATIQASNAILAVSGGNVTVNQAGSIYSSSGGVVANGASVVVNSTGDITNTMSGSAISSTSSGVGMISITASGHIYSGNYGISATGGGVKINATGDIAAAQGIVASGATLDVTTRGAVSGSDTGINLSSAGALWFNAAGGSVSGLNFGLRVSELGLGVTMVTSASGVAITAAGPGSADSAAVLVTSQGGPLTINLAGDVLGSWNGLNTIGAGSQTITTSGKVMGIGGDGIIAFGGSGALNITTNGAVYGGQVGIYASSLGAGSTSVTSNGAVTAAGSPAITAISGTGGLTLNLNASVISLGGAAVNATSASNALINVGPGAVVAGLITTPNTGVINLSTASGTASTINIAAGGAVQATTGSPFSVAIRALGGSLTVNNRGLIVGQVDFSALAAPNVGVLNNFAGSTFVTGGTSTFSAGTSYLNAGTLAVMGPLTTFNFLGGNNVFTNTGTVLVGFNPVVNGGSSFVLNGLATFNNSGLINMQNGVAGDSLVAAGANYIGSGGAQLAIDTAIGRSSGPAGALSAAAVAPVSDTLVVGTSSGKTSVIIHDTTGGFGGFNPGGIVIVQGITHVGDFVLDPGSSFYNPNLFGGAIDKPGLFFSQLAVGPSGSTVLVSAPKLQAYQFATLQSQVETLWYASAPTPQRRDALRDQLVDAGAAKAGDRPGFWLKLDAGSASRDVTERYAAGGAAYSYDASYSQDIQTLTAGFDDVRRQASGHGGWTYGASAGFVASRTKFDQGSTSTILDGWQGGGHADYVTGGGAFISADVRANTLVSKLKAPLLNGYTPQHGHVTSFGGSLEAGLRYGFLWRTTLEPIAGLAYLHSAVDSVSSAGASFHFEDPESLRASIGARLSGDLGGRGGDWRTRYAVSVKLVDDLLASNRTVLSSAGPDLAILDSFGKSFGEVRAGINSDSVGRWSISADIHARFNDHYTDEGASLAVRCRF